MKEVSLLLMLLCVSIVKCDGMSFNALSLSLSRVYGL